MNPLDLDFWVNEAALLHAVVFELIDEIAGAGAYAAVKDVIQALLGVREPEIDLDLLNQRAHAHALNYSFELVSKLTETSQQALQNEFAGWIASGEPLPALREKLVPMFGAVRAEMIAVTEVTRIYADSNIIGWRESGFVDGQRYGTAYDDKVCPICQPFNGEEYPLGDVDHTPPLHVRCRCYLQPVVRLPKMLDAPSQYVLYDTGGDPVPVAPRWFSLSDVKEGLADD